LGAPVAGSAEKFPEGVNSLNEAIQSLYGSAEAIAKLDHVSYTIDHLPKHNIWYLSTQASPAAGHISSEIAAYLKEKYEVDVAPVSHPCASICSDGRSAQILQVPSKKAREQKEKREKAKEAEKAAESAEEMSKSLEEMLTDAPAAVEKPAVEA